MKQFFEIRKVDAESRMVWGYASTETTDSQGETVTKAAMEAAWADYMQFGNIREMHQASAVGVVKEYSFDDLGVQIGAYIVDDMAWKKVVEGVYKGFSIGGKKNAGGYDTVTKTINSLKLTEISLVDRPANPEALITMWKADTLENNMDPEVTTETQAMAPVETANDEPAAVIEPMTEVEVTTKTDVVVTSNETSVDVLADLLTKGLISPERLVELANNDINKVTIDTAVVDTPSITDNTTNLQEAQVDGSIKKSDATIKEPSSAIRKAFKLLLSTGEDVRKGMHEVSFLADLLRSLTWMQQDLAWEAENEGDASGIPARLANAVKELGSILLELANEEVGELMATLQITASTEVIQLGEALAATDIGKDYKKAQDAFDILKVGARNSTEDKANIQKAHDALSELGAVCAAVNADPVITELTGKLNKASEAGDIAKALGTIEKMTSDMATLRKSFETLETDHNDLKKKYEATPTIPKGVTRVIAKGEDIGDLSDTIIEIEPVLKQDGSVDDIATSMKKIHAGGGRPLIRA